MENTMENPPLESKGSNDEAGSSFDLESMDPEQRQRVEEELKTELAKVSNLTRLKLIRPNCLDHQYN